MARIPPAPIQWRRILRRLLVGTIAFIALLSIGCASLFVCLPTWLMYGVSVPSCPDGSMRQTVEVSARGLQRNVSGTVEVRPIAHYTTDAADDDRSAAVGRADAALTLVHPGGREVPLEPDEDGWDSSGDTLYAHVVLPEIPDGDYLLRVTVDTPLGETVQDLPLPIYAPARVHVLPDRPIYQPGDRMQFRALALRARDLSPLDGRPGRWEVRDPTGELLLEERAPAGTWGVVASSFPLDSDAVTGTWKIRWLSGNDSGETSVLVEPFELPRFSVQATTSRPVYHPGDQPTARGEVRYSSGAPVANAHIDLQWMHTGEWPPPTAWTSGLLPRSATTDAAGVFTLDLPTIPDDLVGQATLIGRMSATDATGDSQSGTVAVALSRDRIQVDAVTELADGLVAGFNNRVFLRATTAWGAPLPDTILTVRRAWDPTDPGERALTDSDGVARLQVDPGQPVTVVLPEVPVRPPPPATPARLSSVQDMARDQAATLADQIAFTELAPRLATCARFAGSGAVQERVAVSVDSIGRMDAVPANDSGAGMCAAATLGALRIGPGPARLLHVYFTFDGSDLPSLTVKSRGEPVTPPALTRAADRLALDARDCFDPHDRGGPLSHALRWRLVEGSANVQIGWIPTDDTGAIDQRAEACVRDRFSTLRLDMPAGHDAVGALLLHANISHRNELAQPGPRTMLGYALAIQASVGDELIGDTTLHLTPSSVPDLRMRMQPNLAAPGDTVELEILRGPNYTGTLPEELYVAGPDGRRIKVEFAEKSRRTQFELPHDAPGWYTAEWQGARAMLFARDAAELALTISSDKPVYAPGEQATLRLTTAAAGVPVSAGVTLSGVDSRLAALVALPGADALEGLRPTVQTDAPAFGILDGQALAMGRVQGEHAAAATILRVARAPDLPALDQPVNATVQGRFDPVMDLTDHFYTVLQSLHSAVRAWEKTAPDAERMKPERMAELWDDALDAVEASGGDVDDAYGRRLRLHRLPADLLALTDPRAVVLDATRLPEDVDNWAAWVAREQP